MEKQKYLHISECWAAIRDAKTIEEVKKIIEELPRWSGEWDIEIDENKYYLVTNSYFDTQYDVWETDWVYLDIEVEEDEDE